MTFVHELKQRFFEYALMQADAPIAPVDGTGRTLPLSTYTALVSTLDHARCVTLPLTADRVVQLARDAEEQTPIDVVISRVTSRSIGAPRTLAILKQYQRAGYTHLDWTG